MHITAIRQIIFLKYIAIENLAGREGRGMDIMGIKEPKKEGKGS